MKESFGTSPESRAVRVRGSLESVTDTSVLARRLSSSQRLDEVVASFDRGDTRLRDVGNMITIQRDLILDRYNKGTIRSLAQSNPDIFTAPVGNLNNRLVDGEKDQPLGNNFFVNATGFLSDGHRWALDFNRAIEEKIGKDIFTILRTSSREEMDRIIVSITRDRALTVPCAVYLAGRSLASEQYLESVYGEMLRSSKMEVGEMMGRMAGVTRLRRDMLRRGIEQLGRGKFGSFDHLTGLVTSDNTGTAGDYEVGTLRVEIQFEGSVAAPRFPTKEKAHLVIVHELNHVAAAQSVAESRCGLSIGRQGLEADEGMTEYLTHVATDSPAVRHYADGRVGVESSVAYRTPTAAIARLHLEQRRGESSHFATLFNAYHGDVKNTNELEQALNVFYRYDKAISDYFRGQ